MSNIQQAKNYLKEQTSSETKQVIRLRGKHNFTFIFINKKKGSSSLRKAIYNTSAGLECWSIDWGSPTLLQYLDMSCLFCIHQLTWSQTKYNHACCVCVCVCVYKFMQAPSTTSKSYKIPIYKIKKIDERGKDIICNSFKKRGVVIKLDGNA